MFMNRSPGRDKTDKHMEKRSGLHMQRFHAAVKNGNVAAAQATLAHPGVDINGRGNDGRTALHTSIALNNYDMMELLLRYGADPDLTCHTSFHYGYQLCSADEPPIVTATRLTSARFVEALLNAGSNPDLQMKVSSRDGTLQLDRSALHIACENVSLDIVQLLMQRGADVNVTDKSEELPLHKAVRCKQCDDSSAIVRLLCEHGSYVNSINRIELTPLYIAVFYGCLRKIELLVMYGADVNVVCERENSYGTALHVAAAKDRLDLVQYLIANGAKMDVKNAVNCTPLQLNIKLYIRSDITTTLIRHGCDVDCVDGNGYSTLALCINSTNLECEVIARMMVLSGCDISKDMYWLRDCPRESEPHERPLPNVSIAPGRVRALCDWLLEQRTQPSPLYDICRMKIRHEIKQRLDGHSVLPFINSLPVPPSIKDSLMLYDVKL